ncbi:MAG: tryptophan synthase subunit alpha [Candidatus Marinimicrobia bacterium]|nr:tryptophan synthase subunit alpha [Candidatus Neomarinimicrobiota bacterium]
MENRLTRLILKMSDTNKTLLVPYMVAGYPSYQRSLQVFELFAEEGADIIEIGMPFSDPLADGAVIQHAFSTSLSNGTTLEDVFSLVRSLRKKFETPIVLMGYLNPIYKKGIAAFLSDCVVSGVDGLIIPDLTPEEAGDFVASARERNISTIFLVAPNTTDERIKIISEISTEFIYCVSLLGVTGARNSLPEDIGEYLNHVKALSGRNTLVGFGVNSKDTAAELAPFTDGIVIGSAIVERVNGEENSIDELRIFFQEIRESLNH